MLLCFVKTLLLFEPVSARTKSSFYVHPHLPHFLSLPHSQNSYIQNRNNPNHLRTLRKSTGGYTQKAKSWRNSPPMRIKSAHRSFLTSCTAQRVFSQSRNPIPGITATYFNRNTTEAT